MTILVIGGTGTVGGAVVRALLDAGESPRVLIRDPAKAAMLPAGAQPVAGDLQKPPSLTDAFQGAESVFLLNALTQDETAQGLAAVAAAKAAGVRRIVYLSVHRLEDALHIPHFARKKPVEDAIIASGMEWTILRPNNFFQNDLWFKDVIARHGVYPQPVGQAGLSRVDIRDIADVAVAALTRDGHSGRRYALAGPDALTGPSIAGSWSSHLGRPVAYLGDNLEAWGAQVAQMLPEWLVHDLKIMYAHFQKHGLIATAEELELLEGILGRPLRIFDAFVAEVSAGLRSA